MSKRISLNNNKYDADKNDGMKFFKENVEREIRGEMYVTVIAQNAAKKGAISNTTKTKKGAISNTTKTKKGAMSNTTKTFIGFDILFAALSGLSFYEAHLHGANSLVGSNWQQAGYFSIGFCATCIAITVLSAFTTTAKEESKNVEASDESTKTLKPVR